MISLKQQKKKNKNTQKGFTITELLVAVAVASIASVLIMYAFVFMYGSLLKEQTRSQMVLESQLFLKRMVDDIRVANQILTTNSLTDAYEPTGGWLTSDPANILVLTQPVTDSSNDFIFDDSTGYPYQNEIVYFSNQSNMYRRTLSNPIPIDNKAITTCPASVSGCSTDIKLTDRLLNMQFVFYDINDVVTIVPEEARSVDLTVNLTQRVYGEDIAISNKTRVTLRNEN
jgi:prepilin-type N-terminal cleavage/methylation domain-containing protein